MNKPIFTLSLLVFALRLLAQNPHGASLKMDCAACHTVAGWEIDVKIWQKRDPEKPQFPRTTGIEPSKETQLFQHNKTGFDLKGRHALVDCRACHATLVFSEASVDCIACHTDLHQQTLGNDCARCHNSTHWLVDNITELHQENGFPLTGVHKAISCEACHISASALQFNRLGNDCINCHLTDYNAASEPNHQQGAFSTDCLECHNVFDPGWSTDKINHAFFPLTQGHEITDCAKCHIGGDFSNTPTNCVACHQQDFETATNPNHDALNLPLDCATCHTTAPGWEPASFPIHNNYYPLNGAHLTLANDCAACHNGDYTNTPNTCSGCHTPDYNATTQPDHAAAQFSTDCAACHSETAWAPATFNHDGQFFPIYSGKHNGEWTTCGDCHTNPSNYAEFSCINCHTNPQTDTDHQGIGGYSYNSQACFACHPTGDANDAFDHNSTAFPLTGAHLTTDCIECHAGGYAGTPTQCSSCHTSDFNQTTNPNHGLLNIPSDCAMCHTTAPGWSPATFPIHNNYWVLNGAHTNTSCADCHNGNYTNTPTNCFACHSADFNGATNPKHASAGFPTTCEDCHSTTAWEPSTFNHDLQYFPIYSGKHNGEWDQCIDCHTTPGNFAAFSCIDCHEHDNPSELANDHQGVNGYQYLSSACFTCHPDGN